MIKQGDIYLVQFSKKYHSEIGKIRPAVIMQNNFLNRALFEKRYQHILVVPLTSDDVKTEYKISIKQRDRLQKDSFIIANWLCTLDIRHLLLDKGLITRLTQEELNSLKEKICNIL